jgi:hypothetical protein
LKLSEYNRWIYCPRRSAARAVRAPRPVPGRFSYGLFPDRCSRESFKAGIDALSSKHQDLLGPLLDPQPTDGGRVSDAASSSATWQGLAGADSSNVAKYAFAIFLAIPLLWALVYFLPPLNHDAAALLHYSQRWLAGERLYVDLIDVNPPLVFVLNLVPAAIARLTPIGAPAALTLCVMAWVTFGFLLSWRLLRAAPGPIGAIHRYVFPPLFLFLMIAYPGPEFAQREHLMVVALLPYLLLAQARLEGRETARGLTVVTALFAAVAFALKPHFLLVPLVVEAMVITSGGVSAGLRRSLRDPVVGVLASVFVAYAVFILLVTPAYLNSVVPLAMGNYWSLGGLGPWGVLFNSQLTASAAILVLLAALSLVAQRPLSRLIALVAIATTVVAMVQGKGWPYHVLPTETLVLLLGAALLCEFLDLRVPAVHERRSNSLTVFLVTFLVAAYYICVLTRPTFWRQAGFEQSPAGQLLQRFGKQAAQGPMLVLSPGIYPHFPLVNYAGSKMAMRFMSLWPIQGAYAECLPDGKMFRKRADMSPAEAFAYQAVAEDFNRYQPQLVIVDKNPGIPMCVGKDFDYLAYFRSHPLFEANWHRYRLLTEYDRYWIYVRR